jgi:acyl-coenzyme A synthetase/AMP-(fatty) acid ligase
LCPGMQATEQELLDLCETNLGSYKMPKRVLIRDTLPKGPSGKIQRLKLSA